MHLNLLVTEENLISLIDDSNSTNNLFVLAGFTPENVSNIGDYKLLDYAYPTTLEKIMPKNPESLQKVVSFIGEPKQKFCWVTMEEYLLQIHNSLNSFLEVKFIYNNLYYRTFPLHYTISNLEELIQDYSNDDQDVKSQNFAGISAIYSSIVQLDKVYVSYSLEEEYLEEWIPFLTVSKQQNIVKEVAEASYDLSIEISEDEQPFLQLINSVLVDSKEDNIELIHSNKMDLLLNNYEERIELLRFLFPQKNFKVSKKSINLKNVDESLYTQYLMKYWGYDRFRELEIYKDPDNSNEVIKVSQAQIIDDIVEEVEKARNNHPFRDVFVTSPTGAGKSVMFQLPSLMLFEKYKLLTIVISPLIGLMKDQVDNLHERGINNTATINSNITPMEKMEIQQKIQNNELAILYISPETLLSRSDIKMLIGDTTKVGLFIVDEAHIVTTWGKAFRSDYWYLGTYLQKMRKEMKFPIATFTATAIYGGEEDMYKETRDSLGLIKPKVYLGKVRREDLAVRIQATDKEMKDGQYQRTKFLITAERLKSLVKNEEKVLVYFPTIPLIHNFKIYLEENHPRLAGKVGVYYGRLSKEEKEKNTELFKNGELKVMLATKAFGMGIDISDIHHVYHYAPTGNVCDYVQEIGRAARDPRIDGKAHFDYLKNDFSHIKKLHGMSIIRKNQLQMVAQKIFSVYKEKKYSRNLLVSVDDFAYIFAENNVNDMDGDVEGKLKTALLLIEKDFVNRIGYSPFVARPRGIFSREYFQVTEAAKRKLDLVKNSKIAKKVKEMPKGNKYTAIYELNLKEIWEKDYRKMSFPEFKYHFHKKDDRIKLDYLHEIDPVMLVQFTPKNQSLDFSINQTVTRLNKIAKFFSGQVLTQKFFQLEHFAEFLTREMKINSYESQNVAHTILQAMARYDRLGQNSNARNILYKEDTKGYQIRPSFDDFFSFVNKQVNFYFGGSTLHQDMDKQYYIYLSKSSRDTTEKISIIFGLLESLGGLNYQIQGGNNPEIYIRINSTLQLESMIKHPERYQNKILNSVHYRHKLSVAMLSHIFESQMPTEEFWDVIEEYFLGKIPDQVIETVKNIKVGIQG